MYQVFYKGKVILLTDVIEQETGLVVLPLKNIKIKKVIKILNKKSTKSLHLYHKNSDNLLKYFFKSIKAVVAAGGKIINSKSDTLFIYRNDKWDLPKGKSEKNELLSETAIREVIEETGIKGVSIKKPLDITYHIFKMDDEYRLKITYWFEMFSDYSGKFTPQLNENITVVRWIKKENLENIKNNSYPNIKLLF